MFMNRRHILKAHGCSVVWCLLVSAAIVLGAVVTAHAVNEARTSVPQGYMVPGSFSDLAERVSPVVVNIRTVKTTKGGGACVSTFFSWPARKG